MIRPLRHNFRKAIIDQLQGPSHDIHGKTKEEVLQKLQSLAKHGCRRCYGRGHTGFTEDKFGGIRYINCKCVDDTIDIGGMERG